MRYDNLTLATLAAKLAELSAEQIRTGSVEPVMTIVNHGIGRYDLITTPHSRG